MGNRSRDAGQFQCLVKGCGIQTYRTYPHGRTVAETAVWLRMVARQPFAEHASIACMGIFAPQALHTLHQRLRLVLRVYHQPFRHSKGHHRVVRKPASCGDKLEILCLNVAPFAGATYNVADDCS